MTLKPGACSLHLEVQNPVCLWTAEAREGSADWTESRSIRGLAHAGKDISAVLPGSAEMSPIKTISVTIFPTRDGPATKLLGIMGVQDFTSTSYLNHYEPRARTGEYGSEPHCVFLTITVPDNVFDQVWCELDSGVLRKALRVSALVHCWVEESWMEDYFVHSESVNIVEPTGISVVAQGLPDTTQS